MQPSLFSPQINLGCFEAKNITVFTYVFLNFYCTFLLQYVIISCCAAVFPSKHIFLILFFTLIIILIFSLQIGPNVTIGKDCRIGPGARVRESIILDGAEIDVCISISKSPRPLKQA